MRMTMNDECVAAGALTPPLLLDGVPRVHCKDKRLSFLAHRREGSRTKKRFAERRSDSSFLQLRLAESFTQQLL